LEKQTQPIYLFKMGLEIKNTGSYIPFFVGARFYDVFGREYEILEREQYWIERINKPERYLNYEYVFANVDTGDKVKCCQHDLDEKIKAKKITFNDKHEPEQELKQYQVTTKEEGLNHYYDYEDFSFNSSKFKNKIGKKNITIIRIIEK
jgi:hypothetical protein